MDRSTIWDIWKLEAAEGDHYYGDESNVLDLYDSVPYSSQKEEIRLTSSKVSSSKISTDCWGCWGREELDSIMPSVL